MHCKRNLELRSSNTSYCLIEVVTKAGLTIDTKRYYLDECIYSIWSNDISYTFDPIGKILTLSLIQSLRLFHFQCKIYKTKANVWYWDYYKKLPRLY
jgi:hypothetical protein